MAVYLRGAVWWYSFVFAGRRVQESARTSSKTVARRAESQRRRGLEESFNSLGPETRAVRTRTVAQAAEAYCAGYGADHAPRSVGWVRQSLAPVVRKLGSRLVSDLAEDRIRRYMAARKAEGVGNRLINMELGCLSRALGGKWAVLWPTVRKLREPKDTGRALSPEEEERLRAALLVCESDCVRVAVHVALNTGLRSDEIKRLRWRSIDFPDRMLIVGASKTEAGRRRVPINDELLAVLAAHKEWYVRRFGMAAPEWRLFPWGQQGRKATGAKADPTRPITTLRRAWGTILQRANVRCRPHDLRHTVCTRLSEAGVPEGAMLAIMGHVSRAMLERYSHIRVHAKREAVATLQRKPDSRTVSTESTTLREEPTIQ